MKRKQSIAFVCEYFWPRAAGGEIWSWELCKELAKHGHRVTVLTMKHDPKTPDVERKDGVEILRLSPTTQDVGKRIARWLAIRRFVKKTKIELTRRKPDVIHTMAYGVNVPISKYAKSIGIPCITSVHSYFGNDWKSVAPAPGILHFAERLTIRRDASSVIVVPSVHLQKKIAREANKSTTVVSNWCPEKFPRPQRFARPTLLFVGSLEDIKNPLACIPVAKRLHMPLVAIGKGSLEEAFMDEAQRAGIACTLIPNATREQTLSMIGGAALVLVPSVAESFSLVALEAVAQRTPVAGSVVGVLPELPGIIAWPPKRVPKRLTASQASSVRKKFSHTAAVDAFERLYMRTK